MLLRNLKIVFMLFFLSLCYLSCDDSFNPKEDFTEKYILYFIVRGDTSFQVARLTKSYDMEGFNPLNNKIDPSVIDANINIWYDNKVYVMKDTIKPRQDTSRYETPVYFYYLKDFNIEPRQNLEIEVQLNNGKVLKSSAKVPSQIDIDSLDLIIPAKEKKSFSYSWHNTDNEVYYYISRCKIYYQESNNGNVVNRIKEVPITYEDKKPVYPTITKKLGITFENKNLDSTMTQISLGDENKKNYKIIKAELEILIMDKYLSGYYSTTHGFLDTYSIRIDEIDYSNIIGGYGIFATYLKKNIPIILRQSYVESFGYKYGL
ncbi:MAG: hypothetical protein NTX22_17060 [Ignavibacteriales bacterium]|nr:hypothetical protein [Ignavibacteriales bacterium]